ncbi:unnamed protein product [Ostreobium quekettii]|uniref:Uncharacterized protein n=1 Tax=Ostreobium quekettii TaxID=121088 RepID=A0A8S1JF08_9CHLO|nr:unnamed protein product [Ostreobium quekettii]
MRRAVQRCSKLQRSQENPRALNVHYETLEKDYDDCMGRAFDHLGLSGSYGKENLLKVARKFDLQRMTEENRSKYAISLLTTEQIIHNSSRVQVQSAIDTNAEVGTANKQMAELAGYSR